MPNDGQIVFEVEIDGKHAKASIRDITEAIRKESKKWDDAAQESTDSMNARFSGMLKKVVAGFSAVKIAKMALDVGKAAISAASDLEEVQNVVDVTFGDGADKIERWAKNAGTQFGLTETQAKRFSSTMGAMLKSSGLAGEKIADVSTDLAGLAADMASFYNLDFDTAFQKIRSGLSGETEPLKQLGINMSVANLNAFALQQGLSKTFEQMTQGEQVMLRYQYLMSATADAQGDFARTSDGYANTVRKFETNIENLKTKLGETLLPVITDVVSGINSLIEGLTSTGDRTVLDDFAEIDIKTNARLAELSEIKRNADETAAVLEKIYGTDATGTDAADIVAKYGVKSNETAEYLKSLGLSTDEITEKNEQWLEVCKRLVKTIPGLNSIINTETGEVKGGKSAIDEYVAAWAEGQKKIALMQAQEQRRNALNAKYAELPGLEIDVMLTKDRMEKAYKQLQGYADKFKVNLDWYGGDLTLFDEGAIRHWNLTNEQYELLETEVKYYLNLKKNAEDAQKAFDVQNKAFNDAKQIIEDADKVIEKMGGEYDKTADESAAFWEENADGARETIGAIQSAVVELESYVESVRDGVEKSVNNTVSGLEKIETPMMKNRQKVKDLEKEMAALDSTSKTYADDLKKINDQIAAARGEQLSAQSIGANLKQQAEYMESYLDNLKKARDLGFSDELLASLSDGTEESYDYLEQLAQASPAEVATINDGFQKVIDKKKELTDELTGQQLKVDETYKSLSQKAQDAVAQLDQYDSAAANTGNTIQGIVDGINSHVPGVASAIDNILSQLNRLNGWGINIDLGGFGNINFTTNKGGKADTAGRYGVDFVPRDDYIIRAHEGERLLTAQENQIWNTLMNGGVSGFDLESLGGVMRENIRPGGDVFLDGKTVGRVLSDVQGRAYNSLKRSGWQQ